MSPYKRTFVNDIWINTDAGAASGREPILLRPDDMAQFKME